MTRKLISVLTGGSVDPPPIWLMRQAGRYLPEYRQARARAGSFWTLCMTPKLASEVTLQPVSRFGLDAAILFSDILVVPWALGVRVTFKEGTGPLLKAIGDVKGLERSEARWASALGPVYEALSLARGALGGETAMLGFAGGPWTLATYLAAGRGGDEQKAAKLWGYRDPQSFSALLELLSDCIAFHLGNQIEAGADAVQIFDSWASGLPEAEFRKWVIEPTKTIVAKLRARRPDAKVIGFPRAATLEGYRLYARETGVDAISLDTSAPLSWARSALGTDIALQGNLDPVALVAGGNALRSAADAILAAMKGARFVFNLGHGILPETPISNVEELLTIVRGAS
ncbi:MAG TPA: uroporphyrinogen decarboxylase [Rhizomicrobium sp.]|nr:uroporphyrinogen decarboxylase [Rhizomicrobium sp.]